jgi:hypothetical protein
MDAETREAISEIRDGMNDLAILMAQLAQLICYAEGVELTEVEAEGLEEFTPTGQAN